MVYADDRRIGNHGIGRFAREVLSGLKYRPVPLNTDPDSPLDPWRLTRALKGLKHSDLFFSPAYNPPLDCPGAFVITLHDLNHLDRRENSSPLKRLYYASIVRRACHLAAHVFTVSEFSRERIIQWSGVSPDKVVNVRCGIGPEFSPNVDPYCLPYPYILCVSNRKRHKNELRQIEAFAAADVPGDMRLLFTGEPTAELMNCILHHHVSPRVRFLGNVPEADLPSLYRSAEALLFVSLYEGFGLPVLEAMASGTPVVTSNTSALPETAGGAALLVEPTVVDQIARAIERVIRETPLRSQLREMGLQRAKEFSWISTVSKVQRLFAHYLAPAQESGH
jgi:glycosyltransferase involved in cell wall biosynthesis